MVAQSTRIAWQAHRWEGDINSKARCSLRACRQPWMRMTATASSAAILSLHHEPAAMLLLGMGAG